MSNYLIIGGGVAGLLTARELAMAGASVTVLERGALGGESSWAGGGILSPVQPWQEPLAVTALCRWSQAHYPQIAAQLRSDTGVDPEWWRCGALYLDGLDEAGLSWLQTQRRNYACLPADALTSLQPGLRAEQDGIWLPDIGQIRNPRLLRALKQDVLRRKVDLREHCPVQELQFAGDRLHGVLTPDGLLQADAYILTAGAWSADLLPGLPLRPVKGQMLLFQTRPGLLNMMVMADGRYLIPRRDGRILVGSTVEECGFDKLPTNDGLEVLREFALARLPALADYPQESHWAGLRPGSPGGIPFIGRHPNAPNLFFNCGHFRNGVVMGPSSARLVSDLVLERPPIVPPEPYALNSPRPELEPSTNVAE